MFLKYILYESIWSMFGAKNSKSRKNVPQIPNVLTSSQPQPKYNKNMNATQFVIRKNALKFNAAINRGFFLIFFTLTLLQRPSFLSKKFLKFTSQMIFFSQNLLIKLINYGTSQCQNFIFAKKTKISIGCCFWAWRNSTLDQ